MIPAGSRYEDADHSFVYSHTYDRRGNARFEEATPPSLVHLLVSRDATYRVTTLPLPPPPPAEYFVKDGEHLPFLAFKFMEDSRDWWRIAEANPQIWYPLDVPPGTYMRIPS